MRVRALADLDRHVAALDDVDHLLAAGEHDSWARATRGGLLADIGRIGEAVGCWSRWSGAAGQRVRRRRARVLLQQARAVAGGR